MKYDYVFGNYENAVRNLKNSKNEYETVKSNFITAAVKIENFNVNYKTATGNYKNKKRTAETAVREIETVI